MEPVSGFQVEHRHVFTANRNAFPLCVRVMRRNKAAYCAPLPCTGDTHTATALFRFARPYVLSTVGVVLAALAREEANLAVVRDLRQQPLPMRAIVYQMGGGRHPSLHLDLCDHGAEYLQLFRIEIHVNFEVFHLERVIIMAGDDSTFRQHDGTNNGSTMETFHFST